MDPIYRPVNVPLGMGKSSLVYATCAAFRVATPQERAAVSSAARRAQYTRIAHLSPWLGAALDKAGIAYRWIRWVAYGDGARAQQERFDLVMKGEHPRDARRRLSPRRSPGPPKASTPSPFALR
jgi:hypothetical protein